jgi:hypothetical protein
MIVRPQPGLVVFQTNAYASRLVPVESTKPVVEAVRVKTAKTVIVPNHPNRVIHPVSYLSITIKTPDSPQLVSVLTAVPSSITPSIAVTILRRCRGTVRETNREDEGSR